MGRVRDFQDWKLTFYILVPMGLFFKPICGVKHPKIKKQISFSILFIAKPPPPKKKKEKQVFPTLW